MFSCLFVLFLLFVFFVKIMFSLESFVSFDNPVSKVCWRGMLLVAVSVVHTISCIVTVRDIRNMRNCAPFEETLLQAYLCLLPFHHHRDAFILAVLAWLFKIINTTTYKTNKKCQTSTFHTGPCQCSPKFLRLRHAYKKSAKFDNLKSRFMLPTVYALCY